METKKISQSGLFFKWAGISAIISAGLWILGILIVLIPSLLFNYSLNNFFSENFEYGITKVIIFLIGATIASAINVFLAIKLNNYSKLEDDKIQDKLLPLIFMAVIASFTTIFSLSAILIVVGFVITLFDKKANYNNNHSNNDLANKQEKIEKELAKIKEMKESGIITEQEYKKMISDLISK
ncbi:MAG: hypothetical protein WCX32_04805 [Clostridia bacterium]|jgi:hypothetical protein|nr:hypothetical protein [Clostridia bacterium]MDD4275814.1 hypothetical protein [Clostridia bacterium]